MNKEQFVEVLSGFIAPRMVEALAEQADGKGYFEENDSKILKAELMEKTRRHKEIVSKNKIGRLETNLRQQVDDIMNSGTYQEVVEFLNKNGVRATRREICEYNHFRD